MTEPDAPAAAPQPLGLLHPVPSATAVNVVELPDGSETLVSIRVETPTGSFVFFLPPDFADRFGVNLRRAARQANSGILIPDGIIIPTG